MAYYYYRFVSASLSSWSWYPLEKENIIAGFIESNPIFLILPSLVSVSNVVTDLGGANILVNEWTSFLHCIIYQTCMHTQTCIQIFNMRFFILYYFKKHFCPSERKKNVFLCVRACVHDTKSKLLAHRFTTSDDDPFVHIIIMKILI